MVTVHDFVGCSSLILAFPYKYFLGVGRSNHDRYEELLRYGLQLADALDYLHNDAMPGKLVLHRDLKPDNIGFHRDGTLKLIDMGLGKVGMVIRRTVPCLQSGSASCFDLPFCVCLYLLQGLG